MRRILASCGNCRAVLIMGYSLKFNFTPEDEWYPEKPMHGEWPKAIYSTTMRAHCCKFMARAKVPLSINIVITQDVTPHQPFVSPASLEEMAAVRKAVRGH